ncbi:MAG: hypothetical protein ACQESP_04810 [Candidatus Muiribacteriota bacterium]
MDHLVFNKKGSTIIIVLALITIFSILGISLLMSTSQADHERQRLISQHQLKYIAEAGITHGFHSLKDIDASEFEGYKEFQKDFSDGSYTVIMEVDSSNSNIININSTGKINKQSMEKSAEAHFNLDRKITLNTPFLCQEEITKQWKLKF